MNVPLLPTAVSILEDWQNEGLLAPRIITMRAPLLNEADTVFDSRFDGLIPAVASCLKTLARMRLLQIKTIKSGHDFELGNHFIQTPFQAITYATPFPPPCACIPKGWTYFGKNQPFQLTHTLLQAGKSYSDKPHASLTLLFVRSQTYIALKLSSNGVSSVQTRTPRIADYGDYLMGHATPKQVIRSNLTGNVSSEEAFDCSENDLGVVLAQLPSFLEDTARLTRFHAHPGRSS